MTDRTRPVRHPEEVSCGTRFLLAAWVLSVKGWVGVVLCCPVSVQVAVQSAHPSCCTETWHPPSTPPAPLAPPTGMKSDTLRKSLVLLRQARSVKEYGGQKGAGVVRSEVLSNDARQPGCQLPEGLAGRPS